MSNEKDKKLPIITSNYCSDCGESFFRGEKVHATCEGRTMGDGKRLTYEFYHDKCWKKLFPTWKSGEDNLLMTVSSWKKHFREWWYDG